MIDRVAFTLFGKDIYWYGIIIMIGLVLGMYVAVINAKRKGYTAELVIDFLILAVPLAVIGARAYYVIFNYEAYQGDLLKMIAIWDGGIAIFGAVIGGAIAALIIRLIKGFPALRILDITAPGLILGQAVGRWGNFINQEAYGRILLNTKWHYFPVAVKIDVPKIAGQLPGYYMATFFYEFAWNSIVFIILMLLRDKLNKLNGGLFAAYLMLYGFGRFFIEGLRTDSLMLTETIRVSQGLSLVLVVVGAFYLAYGLSKKPVFKEYEGKYIYDTEKAEAERAVYTAKIEEKNRVKAEKAEARATAAAEKAEARAKAETEKAEAKAKAEAEKAEEKEKSEKTDSEDSDK